MTELTNIWVRVESWKVVQWYRRSLCKFWFGSVYTNHHSRGSSPEWQGCLAGGLELPEESSMKQKWPKLFYSGVHTKTSELGRSR